MQFDNATCSCVGGKAYVQPSKVAMQPFKRQWEFTHTSEREVEMRYWSHDICFEFFVCLVAHDLLSEFTRTVHSGAVKGKVSKPILLIEVSAQVGLCGGGVFS